MSQARQTGALRRWGEALAAVLIGNAVYFGAADYLPAALRHHPFRLDVGLVADFVFSSWPTAWCAFCGAAKSREVKVLSISASAYRL